MNAGQSHAPLFDEGQIGLLREAIGAEELLAMLLDLPPAAEKSLDDIKSALQVGDLTLARRFAHTLKGCAGSFGAARLAAIAAEVELNSPSVEIMHRRIPSLEACLELTAAALADVAQGELIEQGARC